MELFGIDKGVYHGLLTLVAMIGFVAISGWAWSSRRKREFDAAAQLPLQDAAHDREDAR